MDLNFSAEDETFRAEVREFFETAPSEEIKKGGGFGGGGGWAMGGGPSREAMQEWQSQLVEKGWVAPKWPAEFGGPGWSPTQRFIYDEESARSGLPMPGGFGISMIGPIIGTYGNDEQKERFMPDIMHGRVNWCQGYSERGAGSDLANLACSAKLEGDHYVVNGHKIWTSGAQFADWIFCLTRTSTEGKRQEGITFLLFDLTSEGVDRRPIKTMAGVEPFCECFFDNVKVPVENRIGEENKGWTYAKVLLQHERTGQAGVRSSKASIKQLKKVAQTEMDGENGSLWDDARFRDQLHDIEIEVEALQYSELQTLADAAAGRLPGPGSSYLKCVGTELSQKLQEIQIDVAGHYVAPNLLGMSQSGDNTGPVGPMQHMGSSLGYLMGRAMTIYGGSSEVQRNVMAKNVLGL